MEKRSFKKLKKFCLQFLIIFAIVFASTIILLSTISQFVYEDMRFVRELIISLIGSLVTSMVLYFILKINVIPVLVQVLVVYLILAINILTVGYFTYIYDFYYNSKLVIATLITLAIGLGIIILLFYFLQRRSNKSLMIT